MAASADEKMKFRYGHTHEQYLPLMYGCWSETLPVEDDAGEVRVLKHLGQVNARPEEVGG